MQDELTHFDAQGQAHMVDVGRKADTERLARARGGITMQPATLQRIVDGQHAKGDVLAVARLAGIMAAKQCGQLIPLCHPLPLSHVRVEFETDLVTCTVWCEAVTQTVGKTGVEMEALTAVSVALLTIYDMCKAMDKGMTLGQIGLQEKRGGRSGHWVKSSSTNAA